MNFKRYLIISASEIDKINMVEVPEKSHDDLRRSVDGSKVLVRWWSTDCACWFPSVETPLLANNMDPESYVQPEPTPPPDPEFIKTFETAEGPYSHAEILPILATSEWTVDITNS